MNPERTPISDWLAAHVGFPAAFIGLLAVILGAALILAHCWRRTGEGLDEALTEYESWARPGLVCIACGTPPGHCDGTCCEGCSVAGDRFYHTVAGWEAYVELQTFGRDVEVHYEGEL